MAPLVEILAERAWTYTPSLEMALKRITMKNIGSESEFFPLHHTLLRV